MILSFKDKLTEDIFNGINTKESRKVPRVIHLAAQKRLTYLEYAVQVNDLLVPPSNRLEALQGNLQGYYSIRINRQWRIIFKWKETSATEVQIVDYH